MRSPALVALLLTACNGLPPARAAAEHDEPIPPSEPRAELALQIDLQPAVDCEESFDLELYRDRRIELIAWDEGSGCDDRRVRIRYLREKLNESELRELVAARAKRVGDAASEQPATEPASEPTSPTKEE